MSGSERLDSKTGPVGNLSQAYFDGLDMMAKGCEPAVKGVGRWNLALMGLMTRRAQAWMEFPAHLSRCKTPMDVLNEQLRFWQTAASDYVESQHQLATALGACAVMPKLNGSQPRDYMTFADQQESPAAPKRGERKAA